jgi:hypothetical protein
VNPVYLETARLLAQVAPLVFVDDTFGIYRLTERRTRSAFREGCLGTYASAIATVVGANSGSRTCRHNPSVACHEVT